MSHNFSRTMLAVFSGLLALSLTPAWAHHSFEAEFNSEKLVAVTGVLTRVEWSNPHIYFYVDAKEKNGKVATWTFEGSNTGPIRRAGTERKDFVSNYGKVITVLACPAKVTARRGAAEQVKLPDGRLIAAGGKRYKGEDREAIMQAAFKAN